MACHSGVILSVRTNEQWLNDLRSSSPEQAEALEELRTLLLRGSLYTFSRSLGPGSAWNGEEVLRLAEDCAQEALIAILSHLSDFRGDSKFTTWAYKFAVNYALSTARRERWKGISLDELSPLNDDFDWISSAALPGNSPAQSILQGEVWMEIRRILKTELTDRQRQVIKWMVFDEVPMDVVVERLGSNRNAVYKLLHDARQKVKQQLEARGFSTAEVIELFGSQR